jgi:hypothetical protein
VLARDETGLLTLERGFDTVHHTFQAHLSLYGPSGQKTTGRVEACSSWSFGEAEALLIQSRPPQELPDGCCASYGKVVVG